MTTNAQQIDIPFGRPNLSVVTSMTGIAERLREKIAKDINRKMTPLDKGLLVVYDSTDTNKAELLINKALEVIGNNKNIGASTTTVKLLLEALISTPEGDYSRLKGCILRATETNQLTKISESEGAWVLNGFQDAISSDPSILH